MNFAPYKFLTEYGDTDFALCLLIRGLYAASPAAGKRAEDVLRALAPVLRNLVAAMDIINYVCSIGKHFIDSVNRKRHYIRKE